MKAGLEKRKAYLSNVRSNYTRAVINITRTCDVRSVRPPAIAPPHRPDQANPAHPSDLVLRRVRMQTSGSLCIMVDLTRGSLLSRARTRGPAPSSLKARELEFPTPRVRGRTANMRLPRYRALKPNIARPDTRGHSISSASSAADQAFISSEIAGRLCREVFFTVSEPQAAGLLASFPARPAGSVLSGCGRIWHLCPRSARRLPWTRPTPDLR